jgi:streptogramin lyase
VGNRALGSAAAFCLVTLGLFDSACGSPAATAVTSGCYQRQSGPSAAGLNSLHYTEYCTSAQAQDKAAGPDGAVWFAEGELGSPNAYVDRIGRITSSGVTTEFPIPKTDWFTSALTGGPDGALWFVGYGRARVGRITTSGVVTMYDAKPFPDTILSTIAITPGPDGALWFTIQGGYVGRITTSGQVQRSCAIRAWAAIRQALQLAPMEPSGSRCTGRYTG